MIRADNVRQVCSYYDNSLTTDRKIKFGTGSSYEKLLECPLPRIEDIHATVRMTVAIDPPTPTHFTDRDPYVGLTDGTKLNRIVLYNRGHSTSCVLDNASEQDNTRVPSNSAVPSYYTLIFTPYPCYGACYTAQNGSYMNTGWFRDQMVMTKPLSLVVYRQNSHEQYSFNFIIVEILQNA